MENENQEANNFDSKADEFLGKAVTETPSEPSSENKPEDQGKPLGQGSGAEPEKTEQVKAIESDESLTVDQKIEKVKDILGDDIEAIDAYVKEKGYHNDPAWQKQRELIEKLKQEGVQNKALLEENAAALEDSKKIRNSAEYIRTSMKAEGYTQEAIDQKLRDEGFDVSTKPQDDVNMVMNKLNIGLDRMAPEEQASVRANISDVVQIAKVIIEDHLAKVLPKELAPVKDNIENITRTENADRVTEHMKATVKTEGILDFEKDIAPELSKFMDDNPDAIQSDVVAHFEKINHTLSVERLKTGKRQEQRDDDKSKIRHNIGLPGTHEGVPKRTGNFDADADAFLDTLNM